MSEFIILSELNPAIKFTLGGEAYEITHYGYSCGESAFLSRVNGKRNEHLFLENLHPFIYKKINMTHSELLA